MTKKHWQASHMSANSYLDSQGDRVHCEDCASKPAYYELIHGTPDGLETLELCRDCLESRAFERCDIHKEVQP